MEEQRIFKGQELVGREAEGEEREDERVKIHILTVITSNNWSARVTPKTL